MSAQLGPGDETGSQPRHRVFVSFDTENDRDLSRLLMQQSGGPDASFELVGCSEPYESLEGWSERTRLRIDAAEQVIVICGEHTEVSMGVFAELKIAQEKQKPYILLWGRRQAMCTKPAGAKPADGMYSWTMPILLDQVERMSWQNEAEEEASRLKRAQMSGVARERTDGD